MEIRKGLDARQAAFAVKKDKSHRRIGVTAEVLACMNNAAVVPSNLPVAAQCHFWSWGIVLGAPRAFLILCFKFLVS